MNEWINKYIEIKFIILYKKAKPQPQNSFSLKKNESK